MALEQTETDPQTMGGENKVAEAFAAAVLAEPKPDETQSQKEPDPSVTPAPEPAAKPEPEPAKTEDPIPKAEPEPSGTKLPIDDEKPEPPKADETPPTDKAGYRIRELKEEIATSWKPKVTQLEQEIAAREARIKELEGLAERAKELGDKVSSYEKEMAVIRLEKTEAYQREVGQPLATIEDRAFKLAEQYDLNRDMLIKAFVVKDDAERKTTIREMLSGVEIDPEDAFELRKLISDAQPIIDRKDELYQNADAALAEFQEMTRQQEIAAAAAAAEERAAVAPAVATRVANWLPDIREVVEAAAKQVAEADPNALPVDHRVYNAMAGSVLPKLGRMFVEMKAERDRLLDEINAAKAAQPGLDKLSGGKVERPTDPTQAFLQGMGHGVTL